MVGEDSSCLVYKNGLFYIFEKYKYEHGESRTYTAIQVEPYMNEMTYDLPKKVKISNFSESFIYLEHNFMILGSYKLDHISEYYIFRIPLRYEKTQKLDLCYASSSINTKKNLPIYQLYFIQENLESYYLITLEQSHISILHTTKNMMQDCDTNSFNTMGRIGEKTLKKIPLFVDLSLDSSNRSRKSLGIYKKTPFGDRIKGIIYSHHEHKSEQIFLFSLKSMKKHRKSAFISTLILKLDDPFLGLPNLNKVPPLCTR